MKHRLLLRLTSALCALALLLALVPAAQAAGTPAESNNRFDNDYGGNHSNIVNSYLYANPSGGLTRVELIKKEIVVEDYSSSFALLSQRKIPMELSYFGGFYAGSQYNFIVFCASNKSESDSVEVLRVVKYDKNWNRLEQASVYGANSINIALSGSLRFLEYGGLLYIYTCHEMYKSSDGRNHEANLQITVRESDMSVTEKNCMVGGYPFYVSHSFNQFILADTEGNILLADHGDAYPRALTIHKLPGRAGAESLRLGDTDQVGEVQSERFKGSNGDNTTHTMQGGIAETSSGYVMAYAQRPDYFIGNSSQVYLSYIAKSDFRTYNPSYGEAAPQNAFRTEVLTQYGSSVGTATCPVLVSTGLSGGWIMWNVTDYDHKEIIKNKGFYYAAYSADGSVGKVNTVPDVNLSDCQPILYNGKAVWYATRDSAPVFYTLDAGGVTATPANGSVQEVTPAAKPAASAKSFSDLPASHWAYNEVQACIANGVVNGFTDGTFRPEDPVTFPQFMLMLERVYYPDLLAARQNNPIKAGKPWYYYVFNTPTPITHYIEGEIDSTNDYINMKDKSITRFHMATMAANVVEAQAGYINSGDCEYTLASISDYSASWPYYAKDSVPICLHTGVMTGMSDGTFSGNKTVTRAQACAVINRMIQYTNG